MQKQKPGWERVVTSDGYSPLLFYLVVSVTAVFASVFFLRLLDGIRLLTMTLR